MNDKVLLSIPGKDPIELPIYNATLGTDVIDVGALQKHGLFTFDPGFLSTASCKSDITYIDGDKGILLHRGYPIQDLCDKASYLELCYLLFHGELPNKDQLAKFEARVKEEISIDKNTIDLIKTFDHNAHPMAILISAMGLMAGQNHDKLDMRTDEGREDITIKLIAKMPTLLAAIFKYSQNEEIIPPDTNLGYIENFLHMMFSDKGSKKNFSEYIVKTMDVIFMLHADHEQNASTSTVRMAGSTGTNPYSTIAAGISALWGPSHGGANEAVLKMLNEISTIDNIPLYINKSKDKADPFRLMGFGHRVYKNYDPRATILRKLSGQVFKEMQSEKDPLLDIAKKLEKIALEDSYFIDHKLYPNVDFYSGIILKAVGIPVKLFSPMFAIGRSIGWIVQWSEMIKTDLRIYRPRQLYLGKTERNI